MASFSQNPATPQILYVTTGSALVRVNTATNTAANTGNFPAKQRDGGAGCSRTSRTAGSWDWATTSGTVVAWNSQTNETRTQSFSGLDEPYLDRDGRYAAVIAGSGAVSAGTCRPTRLRR